MRIGILALQGDFAAHAAMLPVCTLVRSASEVDALDALIIPGGESTTFLKLLEGTYLRQATERLLERGGVVFGTCAGAILLARKVTNPTQESWNLIDIDIERNGYGRQIDSFETTLDTPPECPYKGVFIRAPRITRVGSKVQIVARNKSEPALVREGRVFVATFHPELTGDRRIHDLVKSAATCSQGE